MQNVMLQKNAVWNWLSIACFACAIIASLLVINGLLTNGNCGDWGLKCFANGVILGAVICALGAIAAIVSLVRKEDKKWLSWLGLVLNGLPVIAVLVLTLLIVFR